MNIEFKFSDRVRVVETEDQIIVFEAKTLNGELTGEEFEHSLFLPEEWGYVASYVNRMILEHAGIEQRAKDAWLRTREDVDCVRTFLNDEFGDGELYEENTRGIIFNCGDIITVYEKDGKTFYSAMLNAPYFEVYSENLDEVIEGLWEHYAKEWAVEYLRDEEEARDYAFNCGFEEAKYANVNW